MDYTRSEIKKMCPEWIIQEVMPERRIKSQPIIDIVA